MPQNYQQGCSPQQQPQRQQQQAPAHYGQAPQQQRYPQQQQQQQQRQVQQRPQQQRQQRPQRQQQYGQQQQPQQRQPRRMPTREDELRSINEALSSGENGGYTSVFAPITEEQNQQYRRSHKDVSVQAEQGTPVVEFDHVTKVYPSQPNRPALDDVSFSIYPGEFVFFVGSSGAGKSTTLNMMIAQKDARPTSGVVRIAGQDLSEISNRRLPYLRRQIGCVFQDFKLLDDKTVYENVAFVLECLGRSDSMIAQQVPEVLKLVGLADQANSYPSELSGGEQQRVSIARAMVNRPPLLICDEPTGNLDPAISEGIMQLLERINKTGTTVICSTHDRETVDKRRQRVIAFKDGQIVYDRHNSGYVQPAIITSEAAR